MRPYRSLSLIHLPIYPFLLFVNKVFVIEDVGRCPDQFEAHAGVALVAGWKQILAMHHYLMAGAVSAVMNDLVDAGFRYWLSRQKHLAVFGAGTHASRPVAVMLQQWPVELPDRFCGNLCSSHFGRILYAGNSSRKPNGVQSPCLIIKSIHIENHTPHSKIMFSGATNL